MHITNVYICVHIYRQLHRAVSILSKQDTGTRLHNPKIKEVSNIEITYLR